MSEGPNDAYALDECRPDDKTELIKAINEFYQSPQNQASCLLKLFLTTRSYGDIVQSQFSYAWGQKLPEIRLAGEEDDVANDIAEEIKIVVDKRIDQICDAFHLTKKKRNLMKTKLGAAPGRDLSVDHPCFRRSLGKDIWYEQGIYRELG